MRLLLFILLAVSASAVELTIVNTLPGDIGFYSEDADQNIAVQRGKTVLDLKPANDWMITFGEFPEVQFIVPETNYVGNMQVWMSFAGISLEHTLTYERSFYDWFMLGFYLGCCWGGFSFMFRFIARIYKSTNDI